MKTYLPVIFLLLTGHLLAGVSHPERSALEDFEERLRAIDQAVPTKEALLKSLQDSAQEMNSFTHPHLIQKDQEALKGLWKTAHEIVQSANNDLSLIFTDRIKEDVAVYKAKIEERERYLKTEEKRKGLETANSTYSDRLKKYIQLTKDSKYGLAKALRVTLNNAEKSIADEYLELNTYLIQQFNVQEPLENNISEIKKRIEESLSYPEGYLKDIDLQKEKFSAQETAFQALKNELKLNQFEVKFDYWKMGYFNCGNGSRYYRPKANPNLLFLMNGDNLSSVLKLDPEEPKNPQVIYSCKKAGTFGSCLDNEQKELCRLDGDCAQVLREMETSYDRKQFFQLSLPGYPASVISKLQERYRTSPTSFLRLMEKEKRLGSFGVEELLSKIGPLGDLLSSIKAVTPEDFVSKAKLVIEKEKQKNLKLIPSSLSPQKLEDTKRSIGYVFASTLSELESILNDDTLQDLVTEKCPSLPEREAFCRANALWKEKSGIFDDRLEVTNLTPDECPRGVFRFAPMDPIQVKNQCEEKSPVSDLKEFVEKLKASDADFWK